MEHGKEDGHGSKLETKLPQKYVLQCEEGYAHRKLMGIQRRRTQIRLAQRAYRQRKETTISALNKRVAALELTIENMNETFLDFNDKAIASGIGEWEPHLAKDLKSTMGRFIDYAKNIATDSEVEDYPPTPLLSARTFEQEDIQPDHTLASLAAGSQSAYLQSPSSRTEPAKIVAAPALGYDAAYRRDIGASLGTAQISGFEATQAMQLDQLDHAAWDSIKPAHRYETQSSKSLMKAQSLMPSVNHSLPPPLSYSYQECSFARRLLRTTLESAVRLLSNPNARREDVLRVCRNTFTWSSSQRCLANFKEIIAKSAQENLEYWGAPQLHIGNAGLHYPRVGFDVKSSPPPGWAAKESMGPRPLAQAEMPVDSSLGLDAIAELTGTAGEWLDSNDVDQYLQTKGIFLDGQITWAEVDIAAEPSIGVNLSIEGSPTSSSRNSSGGPQSPPNQDLAFGREPMLQMNDYYWTSRQANVPHMPEPNMDIPYEYSSLYPKAFNASSLFQATAHPHLLQPVHTSSKVYLDVEKFVRSSSSFLPLLAVALLIVSVAMISTATCLGRTPGFRKSSVDSALFKATIQESF